MTHYTVWQTSHPDERFETEAEDPSWAAEYASQEYYNNHSREWEDGDLLPFVVQDQAGTETHFRVMLEVEVQFRVREPGA